MWYALTVPVLLTFMPWIAARYLLVTPVTRQLPYKQYVGYLWVAAALWAVDFALPTFTLGGGQTDTFGLHTIGGVVATILFFYVRKVYRLRFTHWWQEPVFLYFFVSGLGVLNELAEFFMSQTGLMDINGNDTWWDLTANTLGAGLSLLAVYLWRRWRVPR